MRCRPMVRGLACLWGCLIVIASSARAEEGHFDSGGVKLHYVVEGQGEPVLLIHGFAGNIFVQWRLPGILRSLADDYQVIAYDNRGHGRSDKPHDPEMYGMEMVEDAVRLLDHLQIERAHVVGYSMGAFIAAKLVTMYPDRVLSVTLGGAGWPKEDDPRVRLLDEVAESLDRGEGIAPLLEFLTPDGRSKPTQEQLSGLNQVLKLTNDAKALAAAIRSMKELAVEEEELRANPVPALAIVGEIDPLKATVDELARSMANLEVVVLPGADHISAYFRPEFAAKLKEFLARQSQSETVPAGEQAP